MGKPQPRMLSGKYIPKFIGMPADKVRRRWKRWMPRLSGEIMELYRQLAMYFEIVAIAKANPGTLRPPTFFIWIRNNHVTAMAMGIRRILDCDHESVSLGRLLRELELRPGLVNRRSYRAMMRVKGLRPSEADENLRRRIGGTTLTPRMVARDIRRVDRAEERIRRLVNKRIAHAALLSRLRRPPTLTQFQDAIEEIDQIFVKYDAIVAGGGLTTCCPGFLNWNQVLRVPWVSSGQSVPRYPGPRHNR